MTAKQSRIHTARLEYADLLERVLKSMEFRPVERKPELTAFMRGYIAGLGFRPRTVHHPQRGMKQ